MQVAGGEHIDVSYLRGLCPAKTSAVGLPVRLLGRHFKQLMSVQRKPRPLQPGFVPIGSESVNQLKDSPPVCI